MVQNAPKISSGDPSCHLKQETSCELHNDLLKPSKALSKPYLKLIKTLLKPDEDPIKTYENPITTLFKI